MDIHLTEDDRQSLAEHRISDADLHRQVEALRNGFEPARLLRPATIGDGIIPIEDGQLKLSESVSVTPQKLIAEAERAASEVRVMKFVPASGAATRMFADVQSAPDAGTEDTDEVISKLLRHRKSFAFHADWDAASERLHGCSLSDLTDAGRIKCALDALLGPDGLDLANEAKALLKFHGGNRTPVQEHLTEASALGERVSVHFTVSGGQEDLIREHLRNQTSDATLSAQSPSTDTIALTDDGELYRRDGHLVFRPGGHGALLSNLQETRADIAFIKNVDNVVPPSLLDDVLPWSKLVIGLLVKALDIRLNALEILNTELNEESLSGLEETAWSLFGYQAPWRTDPVERIANLQQFLSRPMRVCGMVLNQGEPGGGPFWVESAEGIVTKQIVEKSQVNLNDDIQKAIWNSSTHFNPVLMACALRSPDGDAYALQNFVDLDAGIVSTKSEPGSTLRVIERPGLWNGGMGHWLTIFVEVPVCTFNPVKTVLDLLRPNHLA